VHPSGRSAVTRSNSLNPAAPIGFVTNDVVIGLEILRT
jgi:hypothetical protein